MNERKLIYCILVFFVLLTTLAHASSDKVDYNLDYNGGEVGSKWNATNNQEVLQDGDKETFYGLSGSGTLEIPFSFALTNISSIEISWYAGPNNIAPSNYYFGYFDETKKDWVFPDEWASSGNYQEFNTLHKFVLDNPVETSKIKLVREGTGAGSGIAISELYLLDYKSESTDSQTSTEPESHSSTKKITSKRNSLPEENLSVISPLQNETTDKEIFLESENIKKDNFLVYLISIGLIILLVYLLIKSLKR